jgi:hypothetical protein
MFHLNDINFILISFLVKDISPISYLYFLSLLYIKLFLSIFVNDMLDHRKEYIVCAAIWFDDGKIHPHQPINIDIGIVHMGHRHCNCFASIGGLVKDRLEMGIHEKEQGFLTSYNRFVTREEAAEIALSQDQFASDEEREEVKKSKYLYSENIY